MHKTILAIVFAMGIFAQAHAAGTSSGGGDKRKILLTQEEIYQRLRDAGLLPEICKYIIWEPGQGPSECMNGTGGVFKNLTLEEICDRLEFPVGASHPCEGGNEIFQQASIYPEHCKYIVANGQILLECEGGSDDILGVDINDIVKKGEVTYEQICNALYAETGQFHPCMAGEGGNGVVQTAGLAKREPIHCLEIVLSNGQVALDCTPGDDTTL